jgi:hypothetical protein
MAGIMFQYRNIKQKEWNCVSLPIPQIRTEQKLNDLLANSISVLLKNNIISKTTTHLPFKVDCFFREHYSFWFRTDFGPYLDIYRDIKDIAKTNGLAEFKLPSFIEKSSFKCSGPLFKKICEYVGECWIHQENTNELLTESNFFLGCCDYLDVENRDNKKAMLAECLIKSLSILNSDGRLSFPPVIPTSSFLFGIFLTYFSYRMKWSLENYYVARISEEFETYDWTFNKFEVYWNNLPDTILISISDIGLRNHVDEIGGLHIPAYFALKRSFKVFFNYNLRSEMGNEYYAPWGYYEKPPIIKQLTFTPAGKVKPTNEIAAIFDGEITRLEANFVVNVIGTKLTDNTNPPSVQVIFYAIQFQNHNSRRIREWRTSNKVINYANQLSDYDEQLHELKALHECVEFSRESLLKIKLGFYRLLILNLLVRRDLPFQHDELWENKLNLLTVSNVISRYKKNRCTKLDYLLSAQKFFLFFLYGFVFMKSMIKSFTNSHLIDKYMKCNTKCIDFAELTQIAEINSKDILGHYLPLLMDYYRDCLDKYQTAPKRNKLKIPFIGIKEEDIYWSGGTYVNNKIDDALLRCAIFYRFTCSDFTSDNSFYRPEKDVVFLSREYNKAPFPIQSQGVLLLWTAAILNEVQNNELLYKQAETWQRISNKKRPEKKGIENWLSIIKCTSCNRFILHNQKTIIKGFGLNDRDDETKDVLSKCLEIHKTEKTCPVEELIKYVKSIISNKYIIFYSFKFISYAHRKKIKELILFINYLASRSFTPEQYNLLSESQRQLLWALLSHEELIKDIDTRPDLFLSGITQVEHRIRFQLRHLYDNNGIPCTRPAPKPVKLNFQRDKSKIESPDADIHLLSKKLTEKSIQDVLLYQASVCLQTLNGCPEAITKKLPDLKVYLQNAHLLHTDEYSRQFLLGMCKPLLVISPKGHQSNYYRELAKVLVLWRFLIENIDRNPLYMHDDYFSLLSTSRYDTIIKVIEILQSFSGNKKNSGGDKIIERLHIVGSRSPLSIQITRNETSEYTVRELTSYLDISRAKHFIEDCSDDLTSNWVDTGIFTLLEVEDDDYFPGGVYCLSLPSVRKHPSFHFQLTKPSRPTENKLLRLCIIDKFQTSPWGEHTDFYRSLLSFKWFEQFDVIVSPVGDISNFKDIDQGFQNYRKTCKHLGTLTLRTVSTSPLNSALKQFESSKQSLSADNDNFLISTYYYSIVKSKLPPGKYAYRSKGGKIILSKH